MPGRLSDLLGFERLPDMHAQALHSSGEGWHEADRRVSGFLSQGFLWHSVT